MNTELVPIELRLRVAAVDELDPADIDRLTLQLRSELLDLAIQSIEPMRQEPAPKGAKLAGMEVLGGLVVRVLPTAAPKLIEFLREWCTRREQQTVKMEVQLGDRSLKLEYPPAAISHAEVEQLIAAATTALQPAHLGVAIGQAVPQSA